MASEADRFTRLQKVGIFLIVMGEEKARQILAGLDLQTVERINAAIASLGEITPREKAAVMIEFGDFFYKDVPLKSKLRSDASAQPSSPPPPASSKKNVVEHFLPSPAPPPSEDEASVRNALRHLRRQIDPGKIDWGRAGYDFGEGFKGPENGRR